MEDMGLRVLVTGGTGFIGSNLIENLLNRDCEVYALIRKESSIGFKRLEKFENLRYIYVDDIFKQNLKQKIFFPQFDVCFHLAAYGVDYRQQDINQIIDGNIKFTLKVLSFCKRNKTKKVINTGSCFEYGINNNEKLKENSNLNPQTYYSICKVASEKIANLYCKNNNMKIITVRPFGVFGEGEGLHRFVPQIVRGIILDKDIKMTLGEQVRDYLYIKDLTDAYIKLALSDVPQYEAYNICSSKEIKIKDIPLRLAKVIDCNVDLFKFGKLPYREKEIMYFVGDNSKIHKYTGWEPKYSIEKGLKNTYEWYKSNLEDLL
ncbi:MAG: NAD(P)-dependent oxidoreductase [Clostridium tyrobutyricum]|jgi:nucleoside-diphosphate-sugar epimerase|nr:NAD(P)-dependent oxidoreductase [Clostridium tyrobutyricum]MCH4238521.1 NAD(P)-dependent oxidoreductase [Clostridium tyrobutyricum]MCH4259862.1 NAD(P)-dependent oxidoreductase [Clostridium tyrobutyricum]MCI1651643.1 NAD(P)-dependent oxidoreductase [Clostridium tyrobutyricum]MCI1936440.1 NAD(P)-dependent oxidoreductase [Clostridium tyrobutyricum]MCI1992007.1 NAD(P)-dependent oxidoreductase [Clostridium tyrobutyricum]